MKMTFFFSALCAVIAFAAFGCAAPMAYDNGPPYLWMRHDPSPWPHGPPMPHPRPRH